MKPAIRSKLNSNWMPRTSYSKRMLNLILITSLLKRKLNPTNWIKRSLRKRSKSLRSTSNPILNTKKSNSRNNKSKKLPLKKLVLVNIIKNNLKKRKRILKHNSSSKSVNRRTMSILVNKRLRSKDFPRKRMSSNRSLNKNWNSKMRNSKRKLKPSLNKVLHRRSHHLRASSKNSSKKMKMI